MRKIEKWKKVILIIVTAVIALRIGYIAFRGEVDKQYYTSASYDLTDASNISCQQAAQTFTSEQGRLNSLEFIFSNISDDKAGGIVLALYCDDELIYKTNIALSNVNNGEWKKIYVNAEISQDKIYKIVFSVTEDCKQIPELLTVNNIWAPEILESYSHQQQMDRQIAINYGYLSEPGLIDRLVMISLWILLWIIIFIGLYYFDFIAKAKRRGMDCLLQQVKPQTFITIIEVIGCMIIINSSGIGFQEPTKVLLYMISLFATVNYAKKSEYINSLIDCTWKRVIILTLYLYAAFALVGQRIWIYPLTLKLTAAGVFVFICAVAWFIPVVKSLLYYIEKVCLHSFSMTPKMQTGRFTILCVLILLIPAAYNLFANNPGISSTDTLVTMITNARQLHGMYDWHPPFYCMVLRVILEIWDSTYAVILVQHFFWAYVVTELMLYLRKKGIRESLLILVTLFTGLNAANYIHINTIWKDIPYTMSLLWALIIIAKLSIDFDEYKSKWYVYLELIVAFTGIYLYRKNGVVSFIIIAVPLVLFLRKNIKLLVAAAISTIVIFTIKGPVYDYFEIEDAGRHGMYIGLSQDILGVYYAGGEVSESTLQMINIMTDYNNAEYSYNPTWSLQSYDLDVEAKEFIFNYIDTFIKNPITMIRAIIAREDALWDIYAGQDAILRLVNYTGTIDDNGTWSKSYAKREYVSLYPIASAASEYTAASQWISAIEWRGGLFMLLGFIAVALSVVKKGRGKYLLIITPLIGHIMSLLLSTGWSDFRYFWPINLLNMAIILLSVIIVKQ